MRLKKTSSGFSLIELMITLAIVAILASIAVPSYQKYMMSSRRTDATTMLQRVATAEEQYFFAHSAYTDNANNELGLGEGGVIKSSEGYYTIAITDVTSSAYKLTATPVDGGVQSKDSDCTSFGLNQTGQKTSSPKAFETCWRR